MKNHVKVDGKLLQTNKKYSQLKVSQKEKIEEWLFQEINAYYACNGIYPAGEQLYEIADAVYDKIEAADTRRTCKRCPVGHPPVSWTGHSGHGFPYGSVYCQSPW